MYSVISLLLLAGAAVAQSDAYGQCGGQGWTGSTTCVSGFSCTYSNPTDYSQCLPGSAGSSTVTAAPAPTTTGSPTTGSGTLAPTSTQTGATPTGTQIRSDQDPTFHLYLQSNGGSATHTAAVLGPEASGGNFIISGSIALNNVDGPTLFDDTATTTDWGLEGDTVITTNPRQLNFLTCATSDANYWSVYLQEGNDQPTGETCSLTSLHLPCLC